VDLDSRDTQRHPLVRRIVDAFEIHERSAPGDEAEGSRPEARESEQTMDAAAEIAPAALPEAEAGLRSDEGGSS